MTTAQAGRKTPVSVVDASSPTAQTHFSVFDEYNLCIYSSYSYPDLLYTPRKTTKDNLRYSCDLSMVTRVEMHLSGQTQRVCAIHLRRRG